MISSSFLYLICVILIASPWLKLSASAGKLDFHHGFAEACKKLEALCLCGAWAENSAGIIFSL